MISKYEKRTIFSVFSIFFENKSKSIYITALNILIIYNGVADIT